MLFFCCCLVVMHSLAILNFTKRWYSYDTLHSGIVLNWYGQMSTGNRKSIHSWIQDKAAVFKGFNEDKFFDKLTCQWLGIFTFLTIFNIPDLLNFKENVYFRQNNNKALELVWETLKFRKFFRSPSACITRFLLFPSSSELPHQYSHHIRMWLS